MVKQEMGVLLAVMKALYPNWAKDLSSQEADTIITVWHEMLQEYPYELVKSAIKAMAATSKYPPAIAEVVSQIQNLTQSEKQMSEIEAWGYVSKAIRNSTYNAKAEFEKLPEIIRKTIGSHEILKSWAMEESDSTDKVIGSQFMRSYRATVDRERQYNSLPNDVKQLMGSSALGKLLIEIGKNEA